MTTVDAIETVYREAGDRLWWALFAYAGDREIASDAAAEAFARALSTPGTIRDPSAWIWRVAFRVATSEIRAARTLPQRAEYEGDIDVEVAAVLAALRRLSPHQRAAVVLFYLDDRPTNEIADVMGVAPSTVSVHLHRARHRLRKILGDEDDE